MSKGYIYIMTNPFLQGVVKIGYTDNVEKRRKQLSSTAVPADYRVYATYEVDERLTDQILHSMIDILNPDLHIKEEKENGKKKVKEFFYMEAEDAYKVLEAVAIISGTSKKLKKCGLTTEQKKEDEMIKKPFKFSMIGLKEGDIVTLLGHDEVKCKVADDRRVEFNGEIYSLSTLALKLYKELDNRNWKTIHGPAYFNYKGKKLTQIRREMNK